MSLINQVLKDLEQRRIQAKAAEGLKDGGKMPPRRSSPARRTGVVIGVAIVLALVAGTALFVADRWLLEGGIAFPETTSEPVGESLQRDPVEVAAVDPEPAPEPVTETAPEPPAPPPEEARPLLVEAAAVAVGDGGVRIELGFEEGITARGFRLFNPDRFVVDLVGADPDGRPVIALPAGQDGLAGWSYERPSHGGLRAVFRLAEGASGEFITPEPGRAVVVVTPAEPLSPAVDEEPPPVQRLALRYDGDRAVIGFSEPFRYNRYMLEDPVRIVVEVHGVSEIGEYDPRPRIGGVRRVHHIHNDGGRLRLSFELDPGTEVDAERIDSRTVNLRFAGGVAEETASEPAVGADIAAVTSPPAPPAAAPRPEREGEMQRTLKPSSPRQRAEESFAEGVRLLTAGQKAGAERRFRDAIGHDASLHDARLALANLLVTQGRQREAEVQLQEGLRIAPGASQLADRYARLLLERDDLAGAIGVLAASPPELELQPEYHALFAALLQRAGHHQEAADSYAALVGVKPDRGLWWMGLAISLEALKRQEAALSAYRRAALDPRLTDETARFVDGRIAALRHLD